MVFDLVEFCLFLRVEDIVLLVLWIFNVNRRLKEGSEMVVDGLVFCMWFDVVIVLGLGFILVVKNIVIVFVGSWLVYLSCSNFIWVDKKKMKDFRKLKGIF